MAKHLPRGADMDTDPLDRVATLGYRIIWVPDFENRVSIVRGVKVVLIDPAVDRQVAANAILRQFAPSNLLRLSPAA